MTLVFEVNDSPHLLQLDVPGNTVFEIQCLSIDMMPNIDIVYDFTITAPID
jgi:hypothetical protein